jgi:hypothetical protein
MHFYDLPTLMRPSATQMRTRRRRAVAPGLAITFIPGLLAGCGVAPTVPPSLSQIVRPTPTPPRPRPTPAVSDAVSRLLATLPEVAGGERFDRVLIVDDTLNVFHAVDDVLEELQEKRRDAVSVFRNREDAILGATAVEGVDGAALLEAFVKAWRAPAVIERLQRQAAGTLAWELRDRGGTLTVVYRLGTSSTSPKPKTVRCSRRSSWTCPCRWARHTRPRVPSMGLRTADLRGQVAHDPRGAAHGRQFAALYLLPRQTPGLGRSVHSAAVTDDPHQFRPGDHPTPFSAAEIREGCPPGRTVRTLVVRAGQEPYVHVIRFSTGDEDGGEQDLWNETPDGTRLTETETAHSVWRELQGHASMPADRTTVIEEEIETPAGRFACLRYTRTDEDRVGIFWFAKSAPGMPLKFEQMVDGKTVFSSTTLSDEQPA